MMLMEPSFSRRASVFRAHRPAAAMISVMLLLLGNELACAAAGKPRQRTAQPGEQLIIASERVGQYVFQVRCNYTDPDQLLIRRRGREVFRLEGNRFFLGAMEPEEADQANPLLLGRDINGDGVPDAVVFEWSGGPHSDFVAHVFSVGKEVKLLATINGEHTVPKFIDLDGDGVLEIELRDWTFAYWPECFASSPAPRVVLRWRDGQYRVAPDLMRTPAPSPRALRRQARAFRRDEAWQGGLPPVGLWHAVLDLLYGGHHAAAGQLIAGAWHRKQPQADALLGDFREWLALSSYWRELNGRPPGEPPNPALIARAPSRTTIGTLDTLVVTHSPSLPAWSPPAAPALIGRTDRPVRGTPAALRPPDTHRRPPPAPSAR